MSASDSDAKGGASVKQTCWWGLPVTKSSSVVSFVLVRIVAALSAASILALTACVTNPLSRTPAESSNPVTLSGYTLVAGQTITIQAVDQNSGNLVTLGTAPSATTGTPYTTSGGTHYTLYPWSYAAGVLAPNYWSPQSIVPDLATSQGHLELVASAGNTAFDSSARPRSIRSSHPERIRSRPEASTPTASPPCCSIRRA
jgi:hypothetical protein